MASRATEKKLSEHNQFFDPLFEKSARGDTRKGGRKAFSKEKCLPLRWPQGMKERYDMFDAWHDVAMQIIDEAGVSFRFLAVTKKVFHWKSGTIRETNSTIAERAGRCSAKTISRDVKQAADLGILILEFGSRKNREGKVLKTRVIKPAIPADLDKKKIPLPADLDLDTACPDGAYNQRDTRCPDNVDTACPITIETNTRLKSGRQQCS
jgi:hypothetical protein